jgi:hypothetical protein
MKIVIKDASEDNWYKDHIGVEFDVIARIHPTFKYREYILENTENNRKHFKDELSLLFLRDGFTGVRYKHACNCNNKPEIENGFIFISTTPCGFHFKHNEQDWYG